MILVCEIVRKSKSHF